MKVQTIKKAAVVLMAACMMLSGCGKAAAEPESLEHSDNISVKDATLSEAETETDNSNMQDDLTGSTLRIGALKGPTSMGLLYLMNDENIEKSGIDYDFKMAASADEILPLMIKGELDIALLPANVASILYSKTDGGVSVVDVNTLGVLYMVSGQQCDSMEELKGKTIYLTGKGTTPDYVLQYILAQNDISLEECTLEYKSEATEVAAFLAENPDAIGLLPQPFVTAACAQNENLHIVMDMNEEWNKVQGNGMVTGVTVVRKEYLEEYENVVRVFLDEHAESVRAINENPEQGAVYAVEAGIVNSEAVAKNAIPYCNITCIAGDEMKEALQGYLEVLYDQAPESVGGSLPKEDFYY